MLSNSNTPRFIALDALRGIAAAFVFSRHSSAFWGGVTFYNCYLAVDLFFLLSGFVICSAYGQRLSNGTLSISRFMLIRVIRFYPVYALAGFLGLLAQSQIDGSAWRSLLLTLCFVPNSLSPHAKLVGGTSLFPLDAPLWSLFFELVFNFLLAIVVAGGVRRLLPLLIGLLGVSVITTAAISNGLDTGWTWASSPAGAARAGFGIFSGYLLCEKMQNLVGLWSNRLLWAGSVLTAVLMLGMPTLREFNPLFAIVSVFLIMPAIITLAAQLKAMAAAQSLCKLLGEISYPLYAIHAPLSTIVLKATGPEMPRQGVIPGMLLLVFSSAASLLISRFFDTPVRRWLLQMMGLVEKRMSSFKGSRRDPKAYTG